MTLRSLFGKPATVRYPDERVPALSYEHMRGHVECDMDTCILCGMCQRVCPVGAIAVDRKGGIWSIDQYRCIQCASCTRECPKNCLSMGASCAPATTDLSVTTLRKSVEQQPAANAATEQGAPAAGAGKPARKKVQLTPEQEARVAAARERKAAKEAEEA